MTKTSDLLFKKIKGSLLSFSSKITRHWKGNLKSQSLEFPLLTRLRWAFFILWTMWPHMSLRHLLRHLMTKTSAAVAALQSPREQTSLPTKLKKMFLLFWYSIYSFPFLGSFEVKLDSFDRLMDRQRWLSCITMILFKSTQEKRFRRLQNEKKKPIIFLIWRRFSTLQRRFLFKNAQDLI